MHTKLMAVVAGIGAASGWSLGAMAQSIDVSAEQPTVPIVQSVGCVELQGSTWLLGRATDPIESDTPYASDEEIEEAQSLGLGSNRFELIGVAEFLDIEGLLAQFQRADFTAPESVNSTGQLRTGHKIAIKGLYLQDAEPSRINLTSVISLEESCN